MAQKFLTDIRLPNSGQLYLWHDHDSNYLKYDRWRASASAGMNIQNVASTGEIYLRSNNALTLTLDGTGQGIFENYLGIGGNTPTVALDVKGPNNLSSRFIFTKDLTTDKILFGGADHDDFDTFVGSSSNHSFTITQNGAAAVTIDTSKNATFAGSVTLSSTGPLLYLANTTSTTGKTWRFSSAANGKFFITQEGVIDAVTLDHTTGNATFAGTLASKDLTVTSSGDSTYFGNFLASTGSAYAKFYQDSNNHVALYMAATGGTANIVLNSSGVSYIKGGNLIVGGSSDSGEKLQVEGTIASGNINISDGTPVLTLTDTSSSATATLTLDGVNLTLQNNGTDGDFTIIGKDGSNNINLLAFDTSEGGDATFAGDVTLGTGKSIYLNGSTNGLRFLHDGSNGLIINQTTGDLKFSNSATDKDIIFRGKDGASMIDALTLDMSEGGNATFTGQIVTTQNQITTNIGTTSAIRLKPASTTNTTGKSSIFLGTSPVDNYGISLRGARLGGDGTPTFELATHNNSANGTVALSIDSLQNSTFAGSVTIRKSALGGSTAMSDGTLVFGAGSTNYFSWRLDSGADLYLDKVYGGVNVNVLSIDRSTTNGDVTFAGNVTANSFIKDSGTSSQFLKADGSVDSSTYLTSSSTQSKYLRSDAADTGTGQITLADNNTSDSPLILGSSAQTNYTLQQWRTSAHGENNAYILAYGASHGSQAGNFAIKNIVSNGEIFFELASGVEPLRMTSTGATFANDILTDTDSSADIGKTGTRWANLWVDNINGSAPVTGGPYLPLAAGSGYPLQGSLHFNSSVRSIVWPHTSGQTSSRSWAFIGEQGAYGRFELRRSDAADNTPDTTVLKFDQSDATFNGSVFVYGDNKQFWVKSADQNIARIIPRGSTGDNVDKGLFSLIASDSSSGQTNIEKVRIDSGGGSWFDGGDVRFGYNVTVDGNLTIEGTTTTLKTQTVEVEDNILQLNTTQGSPDTATATTSGISIYRGDGVTQASFIFDDGDDTWDLTNNLTVAGKISSTHIKYCNKSISNSYERIYYAAANTSQIATAVRLTGTTHGSSHVANFTADILVNHYQDVFIASKSGGYTQVTLKVSSNNNGDYTLFVKSASSSASTYYFKIEAISDNVDLTTLPSSTSSSNTTHEHTTVFGTNKTGTGGTLEHNFGGTVTADPGVAGTKAIKAVGTYASNGDVKLLEFVRTGDAVAGAIEYNDATTDMEIGTITNHAFSIKTNDTRRLTFANSGAATFAGAVTISGSYSSPGDLLTLYNTNNGQGSGIRFSDQSSSAQKGYIKFYHSDNTNSQGGGALFQVSSTEDDLVFAVGTGDATHGRITVWGGANDQEPDYGFAQDLDTGMLRTGTNAMRFVTGGSAALDFDSSQNAAFAANITAPGLVYDATNKYLSISHWSSPPTPAAILHLSDNSNDLDVPQIRIEGRENPGDTVLDIAVKDADVRFNLVEGSTDAASGYGRMHFKTNASANSSNPTRGGFLFQSGPNSSLINVLDITNEGNAIFSGSATYHKIKTYYAGDYTSGFKFSDYNGGIWYDAGADDLYVNGNHANSQIILQSGGATALTLEADQDAVFEGDVVKAHEIITAGNQNSNNNSSGADGRYATGILDLSSGSNMSAGNNFRIETNIPFNSSGADFTVTIEGFQYGSRKPVHLTIAWHIYPANTPYNHCVISHGGWSPVVKMARNTTTNNVTLLLETPGYWPKMYVKSLHSSNYEVGAYAKGWTWANGTLASGYDVITTVPYQALSLGGGGINNGGAINGDAITGTLLTSTGNIESRDTFILNYNNAGNKWQQLFDGSNGWNLRYFNGSSWSSNYINVNTSGDTTFTGDVTINSLGGDGSPILDITGSASATFNWISKSMHANLAAGETNIHLFGKAASTKNSGYIGYNWNSDGGNDNYITLGHYGSNHLVKIFANGNTTFAGAVTATSYVGIPAGMGELFGKSVYLTTSTVGFLIETNIASNDYAMMTGTIKLEQFNVSSKQTIEFSATTLNDGSVQSKNGTADKQVTIKLFVYNSKWYVWVPAPSTYTTALANINLHNSYQGNGAANHGKNEVADITVAAVPSSGVSGSVDIQCDFSQGPIVIPGQVTINPDADSQVIIGNGGTNASTVFAGVGDDLYLGGNNTSNMRLFSGTAIQMYGTLAVDSHATFSANNTTSGIIRSTKNVVSNSTYNVMSLNSSRTIDDYGGLNKDYMKIDLVTPGPNTDGGSSAHGFGAFSLKLANNGANTNMTEVLNISAGGAATFAGDVFTPGLYVNATSAVAGTQAAIVSSGSSENLMRWGSSADGGSQHSYRFRIDQNFHFIGNSGSGDMVTIESNTGHITTSGDIAASQLTVDDYIYHAGDSNTYIYFESDSIKLRTGGTDRLTLTNSSATFADKVSHQGLEMTSGTNVDQVKDFAMTFQLTANTWTDTGINATDLTTGTYAVQVYVDDYGVGGQHYTEYYSGMMSWYEHNTNSTVADELVLHRAGHAPNAGDIQLRTERVLSADTNDLMLQVKHNNSYSANLDNSTGKSMRFKFRRLI